MQSPARPRSRHRFVSLIVVAVALFLPTTALGHVERASYWPDPAPDGSVTPAAGGSVPEVKPLFTALRSVAKKGKKGKKGKKKSRAAASAKGGKKKHKKKKKAAPSGEARIVCPQLPPQYPGKQVKQARAAGNAKRAKKLKRGYFKRLGQNPSIQRLDQSLADAQRNGYKLRPSQPAIQVSAAEAKRLRSFNVKLLRQCSYTSIQKAVTDSGNNDRVEIMPGLYTESGSRAAPTNDPACANLKETNDKGNTGALSYRYQVKCPNDQNLIAVIGRAPGTADPPQPPRADRRGIPDSGPCVRCNLQMQGTGVRPDDVIVEGGDPSLGDSSPPGPNPPRYSKDVGIRADRADGFVLDNVKVRHANEHAVYVIETDGFRLTRFKTAYASEYGVLTFVADHSLIENCDAWGSGDSGIYPGASADLGDAVDPDGTQPQRRRYGTEVRNCDMHHNSAGYSGTDGNSVWVHDNNFYDNANGFTTDVFTAPGHPGFPQDSDLIENNRFYSNNYNPYLPRCTAGQSPGPSGPNQGCSDFSPSVPMPVGTGMWIAGGNHNTVRNNFFYDNWRRGSMLFAVPDQLVCGPAGTVDPSQLAGCDPAKAPPSTSYNNQYYGNTMSRRPDGSADRNGTDFWWDQYVGNTGNCWRDNSGADGTGASVTSVPPPPLLPSSCSSSTGTGAAFGQEAELLGCFAAFTAGPGKPGDPSCTWFTTPNEP